MTDRGDSSTAAPPAKAHPRPEGEQQAPRLVAARTWGLPSVAIVAAGLAVFPFAVPDPFYQQIVVTALMYGALGAAWNLVGGFLGRVSFGHAVFLGLGAYTTLLFFDMRR